VSDESRLVYSTDGGRVRPPSPPPPAKAKARPAVLEDGTVRLRREKNGRRGKTVTTASGIGGAPQQLDELLSQLKQYLGTGGARQGPVLLFQGDHRARLQSRLEAMGYRVKLAGG
jgi:translation initiation factor 1